MDTRRDPRSIERREAELGTDTVPVELVELQTVGPERRGASPRVILVLAAAGILAFGDIVAVVKGPSQPPAPSSTATAVESALPSANPSASLNPTPALPPTARPTTRPAPTDPWVWQSTILDVPEGYEVRQVWGLDTSERFVAMLGLVGGFEVDGIHPLIASSDGRTWSNVVLPAQDFAIEVGSVNSGSLYVVGWTTIAEGRRREVWRTPDARRWERVEYLDAMFTDVTRVLSLDRARFGWVAAVAHLAGNGNERLEIRVAADPPAWEAAPIPEQVRDSYLQGELDQVGSAGGEAGWVTLLASEGADGEAVVTTLSSFDGQEWSAGGFATVEGSVTDLASQWATFVAVGRDHINGEGRPVAWISDDGTSWIAGTLPRVLGAEDLWPTRVITTYAGYLAVSEGSLAWFSGDGRTWHVFVVRPNRLDRVTDVAIAGNTIVAVTNLPGSSQVHVYVGELGEMVVSLR